MVKTLGFCRGHGFDSLIRKLRSQDSICCMMQPNAQKEKNFNAFFDMSSDVTPQFSPGHVHQP